MRYVSFEIQNFKGIEKLRLDLNRKPAHPVFTLVGLNESGKTTILEAIHWFHVPAAYNPSDLIPKRIRANFNDAISVTASLVFDENDKRELGQQLRRHGLEAVEIPDVIHAKRTYAYSDSKLKSTSFRWEANITARKGRGTRVRLLKEYPRVSEAVEEHIDRRMRPPIFYYRNFLFDVPDRIYLRLKKGDPTELQEQYREVIQDVLNALRMGITIGRHLVDRYDAGTDTDRDNIRAVLNEASAHISDIVIKAWRDIVKMSDRDLSISLGDALAEDDNGLYIQITVKEGRQSYYIRERSLGFRWFFGFVLFTHYRTYRDKERKNALFLLDEPASNLHPAAQTKLLDAFASLPNNQVVIYSTHSHHMIRPEWLSNAFIVNNRAMDYSGLAMRYRAEDTRIEAERYFPYVSKHPKDTDLYRPVLDALDYKPSLLEMVPNLVIVEGKNDFYTLKAAARQLHTGEPFWRVYPSTGKDKTDYIVGLYLAWGRKFLVLLDANGSKTKRRLVENYGPLVEGCIATLADVHPGWANFDMEDLIDQRDQVKIVKEVFPDDPTVNKSRLNTAIQAYFLAGQQLPMNRYTTERFSRLLDFLDGHRAFVDA